MSPHRNPVGKSMFNTIKPKQDKISNKTYTLKFKKEWGTKVGQVKFIHYDKYDTYEECSENGKKLLESFNAIQIIKNSK